jgi:hypothetical protein
VRSEGDKTMIRLQTTIRYIYIAVVIMLMLIIGFLAPYTTSAFQRATLHQANATNNNGPIPSTRPFATTSPHNTFGAANS